jgi:hypothetical protein
VNEILLYLGGALTIGWGTAHLYPTQQIVRGFGGISRDNQLILTMEWLAEAFLLIFTGLLVVLMAARRPCRLSSATRRWPWSCVLTVSSRPWPPDPSSRSCPGPPRPRLLTRPAG